MNQFFVASLLLLLKEIIMSELKYVTLTEVLRRKGGGKSSLYSAINAGDFPKPIKLGLRRIGWPQHEVDAVMQFLLRGETQTELKAFVKKIEAKRTQREV